MASKQPQRPTICPECKTPQQGKEPFCEHCGFRLRSQETALEGVPAISPAQLKQNMLPAADLSRPRASTQEEPSITSEMLSRAAKHTSNKARPKEDAPGPSSTFVEGLPASRDTSSPNSNHPDTPFQQPSAPAPPRVDASSSMLTMAPPPPDKLRWLVPLLFGLMGGAILGTLFTWLAMGERAVTSGAASLRAHTLDASPTNERVAFAAQDTFTTGLDEATQARYIKTCYKLSQDARKECAQETLLRDEYPQKNVVIPSFLLDKNEATNADHEACVEQGACAPAELKTCKVYTPQGLQISLRVPRALLAAEHPAVCLTHAQAEALCAWRGGRLPTHDEWELAARGTQDSRQFPWGISWDAELANWGDRDVTGSVAPGKLDGYEWTAPVGVFHKGNSPFGLRDMAGNVSEWVATSAQAQTPQARGGSWTSSPYDLRVTKRLSLDATTARTDVGVRCAYDPR